MAFFWDKHITLDISRGPFSSSNEWLAAVLEHKKHDYALALEEVPDSDSDDDGDNEITRVLIEKLSQTLPKIFPPADNMNEKFALRHDDMHNQNLMVNASGELTALVD